MKQRMKRQERREQLLEIMSEMHARASTQDDFTAEKVADFAGVSTVLLYRLVGSQFQELRSQLEGSRRPNDETIGNLRREIADLRKQIKDLQSKLKTVAVEELRDAMFLIERLDEENRLLRGEVSLLRKRMSEGEQIIVQLPSSDTQRQSFKVLGRAKK